MKKLTRYTLLIVTLVFVVLAIFYFESSRPDRAQIEKEAQITPTGVVTGVEEKLAKYSYAKEIVRPAGYINTDEINIMDLIGKKVILLDFMTYSCINCQRTWPFLNAWYEKYKNRGLEIIGIHTPEFEFEKKFENVKNAIEKAGIEFPVVLDNDYATWTAYKNRYWPRKYIIDIDGFIVYDHIGEGAYDETENKIQELLEERNKKLGLEEAITKDIVKPAGVEVVGFLMPRTPEIYFGAMRNSMFLGNGKSGIKGEQNFIAPEEVETNVLYLDGEWNIDGEFAENKSTGAKIILRYMAEKVFFVGSSDEGVNIEIRIDGEPVIDAAGSDVQYYEGKSTVMVQEDRLYRIIEDPKGHGEHTLEIIIEEPGLKAFTFTFG